MWYNSNKYKIINYDKLAFVTNLVTNWAGITSLHPFKYATKMEMMLTFS